MLSFVSRVIALFFQILSKAFRFAIAFAILTAISFEQSRSCHVASQVGARSLETSKFNPLRSADSSLICDHSQWLYFAYLLYHGENFRLFSL